MFLIKSLAPQKRRTTNKKQKSKMETIIYSSVIKETHMSNSCLCYLIFSFFLSN